MSGSVTPAAEGVDARPRTVLRGRVCRGSVCRCRVAVINPTARASAKWAVAAGWLGYRFRGVYVFFRVLFRSRPDFRGSDFRVPSIASPSPSAIARALVTRGYLNRAPPGVRTVTVYPGHTTAPAAAREAPRGHGPTPPPLRRPVRSIVRRGKRWQRCGKTKRADSEQRPA